ncbi:hypothetical protein EMIHUDRAFT_247690 [Emiliania huxleyi CCMP1516]|uniref:Phospho-2-dehydro-3-deoxyheptonate aldolase n=2 Tax=Emiliania huxleyi TaxID=2903 RepID=A0A0D3IL26_EMIH1|nr:hypothetical protein EMIHUDRAFT_247690 [Emiliania huxleyi CCMP1516]EOD11961.1 hypothetical protein EMIHUDRAFT_247690 [Emiliania huxleyi CCMP1516]|eukprot:XP_005764390.1 hypothetical protein EMIHUDRAFT_247690 [Emiliania huxleyi CCMP1516]
MRGLQMADDFGASTVGDLDLDFLKPSPHYAAWSKAADKAKAAAAATKPGAMQLDLEEALTRPVAGEGQQMPQPRGRRKGHYNLSAHMVWIGDRTRQLLGGRAESFRGVLNPIVRQVDELCFERGELKELCAILNPDKVEGRLVLITRYGAEKEDMLTRQYDTYCDPRLNYAQSIEASLVIANALGAR